MYVRVRYFHGGKPGLRVGDWIVPSPPHVEDGCPICVARREGRTFTVGEFRQWARSLGGPQAARVLAELEGADDAEPIDPPTPQGAVYVTTDLDYATWYAARSRGDLYRVAPALLTPSEEDHFQSFTTPRAKVVEVVRRKVRLRERERRRLKRRWQEADTLAALAAVDGAR